MSMSNSKKKKENPTAIEPSERGSIQTRDKELKDSPDLMLMR